jgi:hypothetical protein
MTTPPAIDTFRLRCETLAMLVRNGEMDQLEAGDRMQDMAEGYGIEQLGGQDMVQQTIAEALNGGPAQSSNGYDDGIDEAFERAEREAEAKRAEAEAKNKGDNVTIKPAAPISIRTAAELRCKVFDAIKYIVTGYIVEGLTLLAGRPKLGKSWLMLDIGLAVARGDACLGNIKCQQGDVLYLALEDNERRLQNRITRLIGYGKDWPECFHYATEWPRADAGGLEEIRKWIAAADKPRLVVVDILAMVRPRRRKDQQPYEADYEAIQALQAIASQTGVAIVVVHHLRKSAGEVDPFEKVSGTLGLSGAADTVLILDRDGQGATLYGRGRDIEEIETAVQFGRETCRWQILGAAADVRRTDERSAIIEALREAGEPMSATDIAAAIGVPGNNVRQLLFKMAKAGDVTKAKRGRYQHPELVIGPVTDNKPDNKPNGQNGASSGQNDVCYRSPSTPDNNDNNDNKSEKDIVCHEVKASELVIADVIARSEPITKLSGNGSLVTDVIDVTGGDNKADNNDNQRPPQLKDTKAKYNWPSREEWAERQRTVYYGYLEDLPRSGAIADYASPEEVAAAIKALREIWCDYGRRMRETKQRYGLFWYRRREINDVIKQLRQGRIDYKFDWVLKTCADPEHATPPIIDPVLVAIQSRYCAAYEAEVAEITRRVQATPIDDAAWEEELQRRKDIDERERAACD